LWSKKEFAYKDFNEKPLLPKLKILDFWLREKVKTCRSEFILESIKLIRRKIRLYLRKSVPFRFFFVRRVSEK